ncbi:bifunctional dTDP-4-dehydrorhamnose 3,5-epimerase family protein/NAD(P)-dependent oxidoreductase [Corynebacterium sp. SCR221107]|uniref:bifunctional dTDP-4-dehydrorhamnose 3,5-epimerase family protein/NAD(P)-dependent oxidoreductase n=1 Tax=Corynebacterium sp. SCR221107 TaxID=3017361 RepID=UPI0022EC2D47|nr:bifunctional dTDP-4-dehydrorhamnose 3,5-epimerase family protein/NAD(P)-dependent oxidoreductase [Corynebacterium sp. SCR221107]WBT09967.1 bifunctional dTDP-4-dehydrorhamnose 3,5-epimerase family protein/NAD(P)-dependent oxidoreductase [Corynebacterium sp. SCR221107]
MAVKDSPIAGLKVIDLSVFGDNRGWFKENWQREKLVALGLDDFGPVQNNISFNAQAGVTRGLHAEPWDKFISVASGSVFGAWCDLRSGSATYGQVFTTVITPDVAVFVPRGVANGFQALEPTAYTYLVNDHWSADAQYSFVNLADPALGIAWPIPLDEAELSDKDKQHPVLADAVPVAAKKVLIIGADGQLGTALSALLPDAEVSTSADLDLTAGYEVLRDNRRWADYATIINAAAYTAVDQAETTEGKKLAWAVNAGGVAALARIATEFRITLVHVSSEYVFDGSAPVHTEQEALSPLGVYGQTKAAGDIAAASTPKHYIVRTSWVVGEGNNFVRTMVNLAHKGVSPAVVDDQVGRLTFTQDLAAGITHLLDTQAPFGTYNLSNTGDVVSWAQVAKLCYQYAGHDPAMVSTTTTAEYFAGKDNISPRPLRSELDLSKITAAGFHPRDWRDVLPDYIAGYLAQLA